MRKTVLELLLASDGHPVTRLAFAAASRQHTPELLEEAAIALRGAADARSTRDAMNLAALLMDFAVHGRIVYDIAPQLSAALLACEANVRPSDIKLPFTCFYLRLSGGIVSPGGATLRGAVVHRGQNEGDGLMLCMHFGRNETDPACLSGLFELPPEETLEEFVEAMDGPIAINERDRLDATTGAMRLAVNALLYVTCANAELEHVAARPEHSKARTEARERRTALPYIRAGHSYRLPAPQSQGILKSVGLGEPLAHRIAVRGHYRHQACGPGFSERRLLWIEPHRRGPEDAPLGLPRTYLVQPPS